MFDISGSVLRFSENIKSTAVLRHVRLFFCGGGVSRLRSWVILATFGIHSGDFRVIWDAKMKLTSILRHLMGPMAPQGAS